MPDWALASDPSSYSRSHVGALIVVAGIIVVFVVPALFLVWQFKKGDEMAAGGSDGRQLLRKKKDDWGPKPTPPRNDPSNPD